MGYNKDLVKKMSLPLSLAAVDKLNFITEALGRKNSLSMANEILEIVIADYYDQLKDGGDSAETTISLKKEPGANKRLLWRNPRQ